VKLCAQLVGKEVHIIDYYEATGEALTHYVAWLDSRPYRYGFDLLPHDAAARELGSGKTREEMLRANGETSALALLDRMREKVIAGAFEPERLRH